MNGSTLDFGPLTIAYDDRVLRPRRWTRAQAQWGADLARDLPPGPVLELCCGAGHIGLLAVHGSDRTLVAVDLDPDACRWTERNAATNGIAVEVREGPLSAAARPGELFALILADPPWVPSAAVDRFPEDPLTAIDGGHDGLSVARECVQVISGHLAAGGAALLQLGDEDQLDRLAPELSAAGLAAGTRLVVPDRGLVVRLQHV